MTPLSLSILSPPPTRQMALPDWRAAAVTGAMHAA